jgi:hypothetical protein
MTQIDVAHIHEQGQDMIIAPLDGSFDHKTSQQQQAVVAQIQIAANGAGLKGTAAVVWPSGRSMKFIAPQPWHPFFRSIDMRWVMANVNHSLTW